MTKPTIESLLDMSLDRLIAMGEVELQAYLEEAIKVCPPIRGHAGTSSQSGTRLGTVGAKRAFGKMEPQSPLAQKLAGMSPMKQKLARMMMESGMDVDDLKLP